MNRQFREDFTPIEQGCECYTCKNFTKAYLAHLFHGKEILANSLASIHNLFFINTFVKNIRAAMLEDRFDEFRKEFTKNYGS